MKKSVFAGKSRRMTPVFANRWMKPVLAFSSVYGANWPSFDVLSVNGRRLARSGSSKV
jgi:hypothetical protein